MVSQCNRSDHFRNGALVCVFVRACNSNEVFGKKSSRRMAVWPCVAASNPISSRRRTKATVETANLTCFTGLQNKPSGLICGGLAYRPTDSLGTVSSPPRQKKKQEIRKTEATSVQMKLESWFLGQRQNREVIPILLRPSQTHDFNIHGKIIKADWLQQLDPLRDKLRENLVSSKMKLTFNGLEKGLTKH